MKVKLEYSSIQSQLKVKPTALVIALSMFLSACAVGPDFKTPSAPVKSDTANYTTQPISKTEQTEGLAGAAQTINVGQDIPSQWWEIFHSAELNSLIKSAIVNSPNLAAAQASLRQAQENYNAQAGTTQYPQVSANLGLSRNLGSQVSTGVVDGSLYTLYNASVNVSYTLDVFGANRRGLESLQAAVDYQRFQLEASYIALTANLVTTAINEASIRAQIRATEEILDVQMQQLQVIERQLKLGAIPKASALAQRTLVAQTRASLPALEKLLQKTRNQLAVYAGRLPSESDLPMFNLDSLSFPQELPLSLPSKLVRQRPDIRANEALLHQASALVGVATAAQYPQITLSASYGSASYTESNLFGKEWSLWNLAGGITQPIFNAGALSAKKRAAVAAYDQIDAQYRATVLSAFQSVADSLQALEFDAKTLKQQVAVEAAAKQTLDLTTQQYKLGGVSSLALLDAKRTYQSAKIALVQAQAARYADSAALFQALGGGWWNKAELADISSIKN